MGQPFSRTFAWKDDSTKTCFTEAMIPVVNIKIYFRNIRSELATPRIKNVNWTYTKRSENVLDVFWKSYVRSIYVLCPGESLILFANANSWQVYKYMFQIRNERTMILYWVCSMLKSKGTSNTLIGLHLVSSFLFFRLV